MIAERVLEEHGMDGIDGVDGVDGIDPLESELTHSRYQCHCHRKPNGKRIHFFDLPTVIFR
jgi:hypothetical protein